MKCSLLGEDSGVLQPGQSSAFEYLNKFLIINHVSEMQCPHLGLGSGLMT